MERTLKALNEYHAQQQRKEMRIAVAIVVAAIILAVRMVVTA